MGLAHLVLVLLLAPPGATRLPAPDDAQENAARKALAAARADLNKGAWVALDGSLRDLTLHKPALVVEGLLDLLGKLPPSHLFLARRRLGGASTPEEFELLLGRDGLSGRDAVVQAQLLRALGEQLTKPLDWGPAAEELLGHRDANVRAEAVTALGRLRRRAALGAVLAAASDESARVRAQVPAALMRLAGSRTVGSIGGLLKDDSWRVRAAAARALGDVRTEAAATLIVEHIFVEDGRVREDLLASLTRLTGKNFALDLEAWQRWIDLRQGRPLVPAVPLVAQAPELAPRSGSTTASFYGVPTLSHRFLMITDLSGSMNFVDPGSYGDRPSGTRTRLDVTKLELARLIEGLAPPVEFSLLTFADGVKSWRPRLQLADDRNRKAAQREVDAYAADGRTNLYAAIEHALDITEAAVDSRSRRGPHAPDTIYLLSDGAPSLGELQDLRLLLEYVRERNRFLDLRFHCVALTTDRGSLAFLDALALDSGGKSTRPIR